MRKARQLGILGVCVLLALVCALAVVARREAKEERERAERTEQRRQHERATAWLISELKPIVTEWETELSLASGTPPALLPARIAQMRQLEQRVDGLRQEYQDKGYVPTGPTDLKLWMTGEIFRYDRMRQMSESNTRAMLEQTYGLQSTVAQIENSRESGKDSFYSWWNREVTN